MKIDIDNYTDYIEEYLDGKLNSEQKAQMELLFQEHQPQEIDLPRLEQFSSQVNYGNTENLRRNGKVVVLRRVVAAAISVAAVTLISILLWPQADVVEPLSQPHTTPMAVVPMPKDTTKSDTIMYIAHPDKTAVNKGDQPATAISGEHPQQIVVAKERQSNVSQQPTRRAINLVASKVELLHQESIPTSEPSVIESNKVEPVTFIVLYDDYDRPFSKESITNGFRERTNGIIRGGAEMLAEMSRPAREMIAAARNNRRVEQSRTRVNSRTTTQKQTDITDLSTKE